MVPVTSTTTSLVTESGNSTFTTGNALARLLAISELRCSTAGSRRVNAYVPRPTTKSRIKPICSAPDVKILRLELPIAMSKPSRTIHSTVCPPTPTIIGNAHQTGTARLELARHLNSTPEAYCVTERGVGTIRCTLIPERSINSPTRGANDVFHSSLS